LGKAFAGLGMVLEFVAHRVLRTATADCAVPVQVTSIEAGPGNHGREIVSLDLTEYGDPLHLRHIRLPFSAYLKPRKLVNVVGPELVSEMFPLFETPLAGMAVSDALLAQKDPEPVCRLASLGAAEIPDQSEGTLALVDDYSSSSVATFHRDFYKMDEDEARARMMELRAATVDRLPMCTRWVLEQPNDWLLKPAAIQHLVRILMALRWPPPAIAALIQSRYDADYGWGDCWTRHDASWRAIFYTRLFAGLIATGLDKLIDLNCVSHKEKGYCNIAECYGNLLSYRDLLLTRSSS
jgi:hypothetical protein